VLPYGQMNKAELATKLAKQAHLSEAEAADQLDRVVHEIVLNLRKGKTARLPGLGSFRPGEKGIIRFDVEIRPGGKGAGD
jgi:nucleoid DNA-binding protein